MQTVSSCTSWHLANGSAISFWLDKWLPETIADMLVIPATAFNLLQSRVNHFIVNSTWCLPVDLATKFPLLVEEIKKIIIPLSPANDRLIWNDSEDGSLTFKAAYNFLNQQSQSLACTKYIWNKCIPPSKSFLIWRLHHNRLPTDENLWERGHIVVSMCNLCQDSEESSNHLFLKCKFAKATWNWLSTMLRMRIDLTSISSIYHIMQRNWSDQARDVVMAALSNAVCTIWFCRNQLRLNDNSVSISRAISLIRSAIGVSGCISTDVCHPQLMSFKF